MILNGKISVKNHRF